MRTDPVLAGSLAESDRNLDLTKSEKFKNDNVYIL